MCGYEKEELMDLFQTKKELVQGFRPIDDVFFEVLADDEEVCQEILRTILEDKALIVEEVIVQCSIKNIYGRSVRLDALCILGDGTKCNIEIQRTNSDNHLKRARYNAASIVTKNTEPGERFEKVPNVIIVYISEKDFLGYGKTIYHIDKVIRENGKPIYDGLQEVFVNTYVDDGTDIAELMHCFVQREVHNPKFPKLSSRVSYLKEDEGGISVMCEIMERYMDEAKKKERVSAICKMITKGFDRDTILDLEYTEEEYEEAEKLLLVSV